MISIVVWLLILFFLLLVANYTSERIVLSPQFGFIACFIPQAIYALFYVNKWDLSLSFSTMAVLVGGCTWFLIVSLAMSSLLRKTHSSSYVYYPTNSSVNDNSYDVEIRIEKWKVIVLLLFQLVVVALMLRYIISLPGGSFAEKLFFRDYTSKRTEGGLSSAGYDLPSYLSIARAFSYYAGFVTSYLTLHGFVYKYKANRTFLITSYILSVMSSLLLGHRFGVYSLIVATLAQWYFIRGKKTSWRKVLSPKIIGRFIVILFLFMFAFVHLGNFIGKGTRTTGSDYIALYLSAQLKNLDIYVRNGTFGSGIDNWQTLYGWVNFFANTFGISSWEHFYDQPFYYHNGFALGNVSTIFYWFLHDGGYLGVFIFTTLMAIISQGVFWKAIGNRRKYSIDLSVVVYSYLFYGIVFSFYSNRFFSALNPDFLKLLLSIYALRWYFSKIKIKTRRNVKITAGGGRSV